MAGGDLTLFRDAADKSKAARTLIDTVHGSLKRLAVAPHIVIASVHGAVAGAGMSLALGADLVVASDDASFNMSYVKVAAPPDCGGIWSLVRQVGTRRALEIALLAEPVDVEKAFQIGLVNRVVPSTHLESETMKLATRIAAGPSIAQGWTKRLARTSFEHTLPDQLDLESDAFAECAGTHDFAEGLEAFFTKRKPVFEGR